MGFGAIVVVWILAKHGVAGVPIPMCIGMHWDAEGGMKLTSVDSGGSFWGWRVSCGTVRCSHKAVVALCTRAAIAMIIY
jgi:hypothetical protein